MKKYTKKEQKLIDKMYNIMLDRMFWAFVQKNFPPFYTKDYEKKEESRDN